MILETLFSGLGTSAVEKFLNLARQRNDARLRAMIQEELEKFARASPSNSVIIVNVHIGDLIQQVHMLAESGLSPGSIVEAAHSHTLPALLSAEVRGRLGSPTSSEHDAIPSQRGTTGRVQRFADGASVYWSQRYGAFPTWGWIARCYESLGGTGGRLGFPSSLELEAIPSQRGTTGQVQRFEGGREDPDGASVYYSHHGGYPVWAGTGQCYERLGGTGGHLGFPTSSESDAWPSSQGTTGWVQRFEGGDIYWCTKCGGVPVMGAILARYFRSAAPCASGKARHTFAWDSFCTVILGTISPPVDDDADGSAQDTILPIQRSPAPCLARSARLVHRGRLMDCKLQGMPP